MKIYIGSDHAGYELKHYLMSKYSSGDFEDLGYKEKDEKDDYPGIAHTLAEKITGNPDALGVLICGSGIGVSMAANRHRGIRAALCCNVKMAKMAREHNHANILCLGGRITGSGKAYKILKKFVKTKTEGGRHKKRVEQIESGFTDRMV